MSINGEVTLTKRQQLSIIAIGLVLLVSGIIIIAAAATNFIPNKQHDSNAINRYIRPLTPTNHTFFQGILDEGDKVHIHIRRTYICGDISISTGLLEMDHFNLSIYVKDSQNAILIHQEYSSYSLEHDLQNYNIDVFFKVPRYSEYNMSANYITWWEENGGLSDSLSFITRWVEFDTEIQKVTPNFTYMILGVVVLSVGCVLIPISFVKKFR